MNKNIYIFITVLIIAAVGFWSWKNTQQKNIQINTQTENLTCKDCNVLIVAYDTLGANKVSSFGYQRQTTPALDQLADHGVKFTNNISPSSWTVPTFMSIFTGLYPTEHKVVNKFTVFTKDQKVISNLAKLSPSVETLAQQFKNNGYVTGGFTGDAGVSATFGDNQGFDVYTDESIFGSIANSTNHALPWLAQNKDKKFFMFLHGYDSHGQFKVSDNYEGKFTPQNYTGPYKGTIKEQSELREKGLAGQLNLTSEDVNFWNGWYDSKIFDADSRFANFWSEFEKMDLQNKTIVVILSDHGEEVYNHKGFDHGHSLYDELVHVPLVFIIPGAKSRVVNEQTTTLDLVPTLFDLTGITPDKQYQFQIRGKSLLGFLNGQKEDAQDVFIETDYRTYTFKRGIRTKDGWKYILTLENGKQELYNLNSDPHELNNLVDKNPKLAADLEKRVKDHMLGMGENPSETKITGCLPVYSDQCQ